MQISSSILLLALFAVFFAKTAESTSPSSPDSVNRYSVEPPKKSNARDESEAIYLNYRLPNETYPENYDIKLTTNVHTGEKAFKGEVKINIVVVNATRNIVLHARQIVISKVTIENLTSGESEELWHEYELKREFLTLTRKNYDLFAAKTKWILTLAYSGRLRDDRGGFYLSKYIDDDGNVRYLATTQFEATNARHAFPCYDEPNKRANFTITINHSPTYTAISNMPVNEDLSSDGKTVFLTTVKIPTYIVAFVVSDFKYTEGILNGITQRVYSRPNTKNHHEWALKSGMMIEEHLSEYFGVELMIPKIDHVAIPDFAPAATENWGLPTYREEHLLYDNETSTVNTKTFIAINVAHLISHHWLGNYVTIQSWTYRWMKEGLASLFAYKALNKVNPELDVWQEFYTNDYQGALIMNEDDSTPLNAYVEIPNDIPGLRNSFLYSAACSVFHMWNHALTDKIFKRAIHIFLTKNQYSAATEEQLFTAIQTATKEENFKIPATISEMMSTWTQQGGYPILTVTRNYRDGTFSVKQEASFNEEIINDNRTWYVPINYAVASNSDFRDTEATHYLLKVNEMIIDDLKIDKKDWLILNKQSTGYYRLNYDRENWNLIAEGLIEKPFSIHVGNRAQLMDDAYHFTVSNRLEHAVLLKLLSYLKQEDQYAPWLTAKNIFSTCIDYLSGNEKYDDLKFFVAEQVIPIYKKLGVNEVSTEPNYNKYTRNEVIDLACRIGVKECLQDTNNKLKSFVIGNTLIEPNLEKTILCNGLRQSSDEVFNLMFQKFMHSTVFSLRLDLISSLGCTQNETQIKKLIYSTIDKSNNLLNTERYFMLFPVYSAHEIGLLTCIDFLSENWRAYGNLRSNADDTSPLDLNIRGMASYVTNKKQKTKLLALVAKVKNSELVKDSLEKFVKKKIAKKVQWRREHGKPIMSWITRYRVGKSNVIRARHSA